MESHASAGTSEGTDDPDDSRVKLLGTCLLVGGALGVVGFVVFLITLFATNTLWAPLGLIPAAAAGYGVRKVAAERGGILTALIALVTGMGPLALLYVVLLAGGWGIGRTDVVIMLFGPYIALKLGTGTDAETLEDKAELGEDEDLEDVDDETAAQLLTADDPEAALAEELDEDASGDQSAAGQPSASASADDADASATTDEDHAGVADEDGDDEGTASDFVETGFDEDDF